MPTVSAFKRGIQRHVNRQEKVEKSGWDHYDDKVVFQSRFLPFGPESVSRIGSLIINSLKALVEFDA